MTRRTILTPGHRLCCPNPDCGKPIPRLVVTEGHGFATCSHKVGHGPTRRRCSQHLYWHCTDLLCVVIAVTAEEHARFVYSRLTHEDILAELGMNAAAHDEPPGKEEAA